MKSNWCWIHAEFMLISFQPELHNVLYSNWDQIGVEFMPNSSWIFADFMLISFLPWIFSMNSTPLLCKVLHKTVWKIQFQNEISMKSAKIQHEFGMNSTPIWSQLLYKTLCNAGWKWNQHEFSMNSTPFWFQLLYKALWKRVCTNHLQSIVVCLFPFWIEILTVLPKTWPCPQPQTTNTNHQFYLYWILNNKFFKGVETTN